MPRRKPESDLRRPLVEQHPARLTVAVRTLLGRFIGESRARAWVGQVYALSTLVYYSIRVQYTRAALGILWAVLTPLLFLAVYLPLFTYVFTAKLPGVDEGPYAYPLFVVTGFLMWNGFNEGIQNGSASLLHNPGVVRHSPAPSFVLPMVKVAGSLVTLTVGLLCMLAVLTVLGQWPGLRLLLLPVVLGIYTVFVIGLVLMCASLAVYLPDVLQILSTVLMLEFFACPVLYSITTVPEALRPYIAWNPVTPFLTLIRAALLHSQPFDPMDLAMSGGWAFGALVIGILVYRRLEPGLSDAS